ncbi:MAG: hypothetical protein IPO92_00955 [Saprospiraceae bacterium]|nr:hypothetical protein [Saprospiraceae bacterium]
METILALNELKKSLGIKNNTYEYSEKLKQFETLLNENSQLTDEIACKLLYEKKNKSQAYKSLKYRMEEKLLNDIFMAASNEHNLKTSDNASIVVSKFTTVAQTLLKNSQRKASILLMEKTLKLAIKYSIIDYVLMLMNSLCKHYSYVEPNGKKMKYYMQSIDYYLEIFAAQNYIERCNAIISNMYLANDGCFNKNQLIEMETMIIKMNELKEKYYSATIYSLTFDLTYFYYASTSQYSKALDTAKESLQVNLGAPGKDLFGLYQSKRNIALSYFHLREYEKANKWFIEVFDILTPGSRSWFYSTSLYYLNLINSRNYPELIKLSLEVLNNKNLSKTSLFREQWIIREAYLHFLIRMGKITLSVEDSKKLKPFVISKFMNSVPFYSKNKSGQNITIIVIQILFLILDRKYNKVIDRIDGLNQYTYRYLRNDETFRSNCFIKMLLLAIKADFHPVRTQTYTNDLRKKLNNAKIATEEKSAQIEIIPYDYLWELILEMLKKNK